MGRSVLPLLLALSACAEGGLVTPDGNGGEYDLTVRRDMSVPHDLAVEDLAKPPDLLMVDLFVACPNPGTKPCAGICIPMGNCCTNADCSSIAGGVCPGPGGQCGCNGGFKLCSPLMSCIQNAACCTASDCVNTSHVASTACNNGSCAVATCQSGYQDANGNYLDGCECGGDDGFGHQCTSATPVGTLGAGGSATRMGYLTQAGVGDWFSVTFGNTGSVSYHPRISVSGGPPGTLIDVYSNCSGGTMGCGEGGASTGRTSWEVANTNGQTNGNTWGPTPAVGSGGTVYIQVHSGSTSCNPYTLTINN
jgi:hypothetical protein